MNDSSEKESAPPPAGNQEKQDKPAEAPKAAEAKTEPQAAAEAEAKAKEGAEAKTEAKEGAEAKAEAKEGAEAKTEAKEGAEAKAEAKEGTEGKVEAKEAAAGGTSPKDAPGRKTVVRPASKRALETARRSARPAASSSAPGTERNGSAVAAQPPRHDLVKAIAMGACIALFFACVGVAIWKWPVISKRWNRMFGPPKEVVHKLPEDVQKMVDDMEQAELLYADAAEKAQSDKLEDLQDAQRKLGQARDAWGAVNEYGYSYPGFEEKRSRAGRMLETTQKEFHELSQRVYEKELEARRTQLKAEQETKTEQPAAVAKPAVTGGVELIDEEAFKKMEKDDPSEFERYSKLIQKGKAKFKPKTDGEAQGKAPAP